MALFFPFKKKQGQNFYTYLKNHRDRIINYDYYQTEQICAIASSAIKSIIKEIDRRLKISELQWKIDNITSFEISLRLF